METLEEIKSDVLSEMDRGEVAQTEKNIEQLLKDSGIIWEEWKEILGQDQDSLNIEVDFEFYSAYSKQGSELLASVLEKNDFTAHIRSKRILLLFKGYEIKVSSKREWTLDELNYEIERLGWLGRKYNCLIEGYGTLLKPE